MSTRFSRVDKKAEHTADYRLKAINEFLDALLKDYDRLRNEK